MSTPKPRWSVWTYALMIPLLLAIGVELLLVYVIIDDTISPPRIINGHADDAPRAAAFILGFFVALLYLSYAALVVFFRFLVQRWQRVKSGL